MVYKIHKGKEILGRTSTSLPRDITETWMDMNTLRHIKIVHVTITYLDLHVGQYLAEVRNKKDFGETLPLLNSKT